MYLRSPRYKRFDDADKICLLKRFGDEDYISLCTLDKKLFII